MSNTEGHQNQEIDPIIGFDPWFLKPPKEALEIKHSDYYIKHHEKKKGNRKVYQKVQFDEYETQHIEILKQEMEKQQIQVPHDWKVSDYLKMCYCGRFDPKKDIKAAKEHIEWRKNTSVHQLDNKSRGLLENGMIYLLGRDEQFRPIVYLDCTKINLKQDGEETILKAICVFLDMIKTYMFLDYYIENWIMVIDTGCLGLSSLPINGLKLIIKSMSINYCATMDKMFILNPSFMLNTSWNIIKGFIDPESVEKISFVKPKEYKEMQKRIPIKYLQKKYGGEHQDLTKFWPPINVYYSDQERAKMLKSQQQKAQMEKDKLEKQASLNKKQNQTQEKPVQASSSISNDSQLRQKQESNHINGQVKTKDNTGSAAAPINGISGQIINQNNCYGPIVNDGIKPKIYVLKVKDDHADSQYANAGYDEQLETQLRIESDKRRKEAELLKQKQQEEAQREGIQKQGINGNSTVGNGGISTAAGGVSVIQGSQQCGNTTINNINITTTDYSEKTNQATVYPHKNNKKYSSAQPDIIDSKQEESTTNNGQNKYQNIDADTDPMLFDHHNMQNNPIIQFEGDDSSAANKCCQNCTIF